jgi:NAD(P)-dependent dehydrogenase (short-subunit alcohol dehydrogenase family)
MKIQGSVALVSGANRGLGRAFAEALVAAGAKVYAGTRDPSKIDVPSAHPVRLDVTRAEDIAAAVRGCRDVTLLVNNAGAMQRASFLAPDAESAARSLFETNFFGTLALSRAFAPVLGANGGGAIVNVLSVLSWLNLPQAGAYGASKAAAWALTNGLRNELRPQGTRVIAVHAAFIDTDMARGVPAPKTPPAAVVAQVLEAIEAGREEVLADDITRNVKRGLAAEPASYIQGT